jgi:FKBP-type peptidyl-prolyl cis-trans isomerase
MKKGEKAVLRCRSDYAYGKGGSGKIPPDATLDFDVELISFGPKKKEKWELSNEEKEQEATKLKEEGTALFKEKRFKEALEKYEEAADYIDHQAESEPLWVTCKLNAAQVPCGNAL